jgi:hypothetical protein
MLRDVRPLHLGYPGRFTRWQCQHLQHIAAVAVQLYAEIPAARRRITAQPGDAAEHAASRDRITAACSAAGIAPQGAATIGTALTAYLWGGGGRADQVEEWVWRAMLLLNRTAGGLQTREGRMLLPLGQEITPRAIGALTGEALEALAGNGSATEGMLLPSPDYSGLGSRTCWSRTRCLRIMFRNLFQAI